MSFTLNFHENERSSNSESNDEEDYNQIIISDINECKTKIDELYIYYNNNKYIQNKIKNYIINTLPNTLNNIIVKNEKKIEEREKTKNNINDFISKFLNNHKYFYNSSSDIYFYYDDHNYNTIKEDTIINNINNYINSVYKNNNEILNNIDQIYEKREKIKSIIFKKIKETTINNYIPESSTIQKILSLLVPTFFSEKIIAKYFLVCIGDIILKKNDNNVFLINNNAKPLIKLLSSYSYNFFGTAYFSDFKYKYHEQQKSCKIIKINNINHDLLSQSFHKNILNILCIAIHYSIRFSNSNTFLENEGDLNINNYVTLLNNNKIVDDFISKYLDITQTNTNLISSKNMHYLWKDYLTFYQIPNINFMNSFKNILKDRINYDETVDQYYNVISKYLPTISNFLHFWENYFKVLYQDNENCEYKCNEIDTSEILTLYKSWVTNKSFIKEETIIQILNHYYEDIKIVEKTIKNVNCSLWDKCKDIEDFLVYYKKKLKINNEEYPQSLVCIYAEYVNYAKKFVIIVNKNYFMKFIKYNLKEFVEDEIIVSKWWL